MLPKARSARRRYLFLVCGHPVQNWHPGVLAGAEYLATLLQATPIIEDAGLDDVNARDCLGIGDDGRAAIRTEPTQCFPPAIAMIDVGLQCTGQSERAPPAPGGGSR